MTRKLKLVCASAIAVALLASPGAAQASPPVAQTEAVSTVADVSSYWTDKRMANATPANVVLPGDPVAQEGAASGPSTKTGPIPYTSYEIPDTTAFPNRVHGKVFFTKPGGTRWVCSATVVNGTNDSTVITAGHCVYGGSFWTNWAFVPGYRKVNDAGDAPYGIWSATTLMAPTQWTQTAVSPELVGANFRYDEGAAVINRNTSGQELEDVVGARGITFNQPTSQHFTTHGYPASSPFDGYKLWACESDYGGPDPLLGDTSPQTMAIGCDMTGGSSGGGWVLGNGAVNSVNSYKYRDELEVMFGPYFGSTAQALFNAAQSSAPGQQAAEASVPPPAQPATPVRSKCRKARKRGGKKKRCRRALRK